ncbi:hypothetical protein GE061_014301 [Apolygus lucorum]|uniref:Uncharacterized protein n=1 Tax=Apolygus lucorum TaxID=248454 RepID=A0A8S9XSX1_APOLU|nr:hypothetical protein GE061_014301 [Apolygus lucorum]
MAWGYWSASAVHDRGRSPRRGNSAVEPDNGLEDEEYPPPMSRRPSLADIEFSGPAVVHVLGGSGGRPPLSLPPPIVPPVVGPGTSGIPPPPAVPRQHECFMHQSSALVHHHQCRVHDLSPSDEEDEPTYATGKSTSSTSQSTNSITCLTSFFKLREKFNIKDKYPPMSFNLQFSL